jgi:hypothetical protein
MLVMVGHQQNSKGDKHHEKRYPFPDLNSLPEDIRQRIAEYSKSRALFPMFFWPLLAGRPSGAPSLPTTMR